MRPILLTLFLTTFVRAEPTIRPLPDGLGVNIHFTNPKPGELKMMTDAGIRLVRMDFFWQDIEQAKGRYDFSKYDGLVKALDEYHIRPWFILDYGNTLYGDGPPHTDEQRAAMAAFAAAAVSHFDGRHVVWEMYNEPNIKQFWKPVPNVDDYAKLSRAVGAAIRKSSPKATFVGPATSGVDLKFLEACFKAGCLEDWDAVSVHPYRQSGPESAVKDYAAARALIAKYAPAGKSVPLLSGEWGYSGGWKNYSDDLQARYLAREWLVNQWQGVPISIWYDWHDDGIDPKEPEHHFGMVHNKYLGDSAYEPKPAYLAAKTLTANLDGFQFGQRMPMGPTEYVLAFVTFGEGRIVAWTTADKPVDVALDWNNEPTSIVGLTGDVKQVTPVDGKLKLTLTGDVQYIRGTNHRYTK